MRCPGGAIVARRSRRRKLGSRREPADRVEIEMACGDFGEPREPLREVAMLVCLHQTEMPLGQDEIGGARDRAEDGNAERGDGVGHELHMPLAAGAIEHDAADPHLGVVGGESAHQGRRRLRLARNVDDEHDRQAETRGEIRGGAACGGARPECRRTGPCAPSMTRRSAPLPPLARSASISAGLMAQLSRLKLCRPVAA